VKGLKGSRGDNSPKFTDEQQLEELLSTLSFAESSVEALDEEEEINIGSLFPLSPPSLSPSLGKLCRNCQDIFLIKKLN
jgi:hypothetical protein